MKRSAKALVSARSRQILRGQLHGEFHDFFHDVVLDEAVHKIEGGRPAAHRQAAADHIEAVFQSHPVFQAGRRLLVTAGKGGFRFLHGVRPFSEGGAAEDRAAGRLAPSFCSSGIVRLSISSLGDFIRRPTDGKEGKDACIGRFFRKLAVLFVQRRLVIFPAT